MNQYKVPVQSLIDHIKTAVDVDPWAKEMAEKLLKKHKLVKPIIDEVGIIHCGSCNAMLEHHPFYCWYCGQKVK